MENSGAIGPVSTPPGLTEDAEVIDCDVPDIINVNERFEMVNDDKAYLCCNSCEEEEWIHRNCDCSENIIERDGDENLTTSKQNEYKSVHALDASAPYPRSCADVVLTETLQRAFRLQTS